MSLSESEWESKFRTWMGSASDTEKARREHAESMIRSAIHASSALGQHKVRVFAQGSFRNNTNIPQESDVDICVLCSDTIWTDTTFVPNFTDAGAGLTPGTYPYGAFKNDVEKALVSKFGRGYVVRRNKHFDVVETGYRVDGDVVAAFEHRRYTTQTAYVQPVGTQFYADDATRTVNWPEQHYVNGVAKNTGTSMRFKGVTRILKSLRYEMLDAGLAEAKPISSYLIECLVFNAPKSSFGHPRVFDDVRDVMANVWTQTKVDATCWDWGEVNEMKYLFRGGQPWTRPQANEFMLAAWRFVGFK
jgi:Nucleotidyltransferase domain